MNVLVTGAAGNLGSTVCHLLKGAGIAFRAVDKIEVPNIEYPIEVVDLLNPENCKKVLQGVTHLVHFANHPSWNTGTPQEIYIDNVTMNMNLFQAAANLDCRRIIFSSTIQLMTGQKPTNDRNSHDILLPYLPMDSNMPSIPRNSYSLSKVATEAMLRYFSDTKGLTTISIRYPWLLDSQLLGVAVKQGGIKRGKCYDGYAYVPIYAGAEAAIKAITADVDGYRQYFVAAKDNLEQRPTREVIEEQLFHLPCKKPLEEMDSLVDCSKEETELGWQQPKSLLESYKNYVNIDEFDNPN